MRSRQLAVFDQQQCSLGWKGGQRYHEPQYDNAYAAKEWYCPEAIQGKFYQCLGRKQCCKIRLARAGMPRNQGKMHY
jgi:hypothetical protein